MNRLYEKPVLYLPCRLYILCSDSYSSGASPSTLFGCKISFTRNRIGEAGQSAEYNTAKTEGEMCDPREVGDVGT